MLLFLRLYVDGTARILSNSKVFSAPASLEKIKITASQLPELSLPSSLLGKKIAVAVSGGADSIYLLCALWANPAIRSHLLVLHFDHAARGIESTHDALFVKEVCRSLSVPCYLGRRTEEGPASEATLREARNAFFAEQRKLHDFNLICTAHHLNDVAETLLMRLARGAGLTGLSAPRVLQNFRDGHVRYRPLIAARLGKNDILEALQRVDIPWREDATNQLPIVKRNRIRRWLNKNAEEALGPDYTKGFAQSADIIEQARTALLTWAKDLGCVKNAEGVLDVSALKNRPVALAYVVIHEFLQECGLGAVQGASLELLVKHLCAGTDIQVSVLSKLVKIKSGKCFLTPEALAPLGTQTRGLVLGVLDSETGLLAEVVTVDENLWAKLSRGDIPPTKEVYLSPAAVGALFWRGRMEGDRYQPLGSSGTAKVSDLLINRKVPSELRENLPVVLLNQEIIWVPSNPPAELYRLNGPIKGALRLTWLNPCLI